MAKDELGIRLLDEHEAAALLGVKVSWLRLRRWPKTRGEFSEGPPWIACGKFAKYHPRDIAQWIEQHRVRMGGGK